MKKLVISTLFVMQVFFVFAQNISGVSGKVVDAKTKKPLQNAIASIQNSNLTQLTNAEGKFIFESVAIGNQLVQIKVTGFKDQLLTVKIEAGKILDLGTINLESDITEERQLSLITITDSDWVMIIVAQKAPQVCFRPQEMCSNNRQHLTGVRLDLN